MRSVKGNLASPMIEHDYGMIAEIRLHHSAISAAKSADSVIGTICRRFCGTDAD
jgi:hypothetical protein